MSLGLTVSLGLTLLVLSGCERPTTRSDPAEDSATTDPRQAENVPRFSASELSSIDPYLPTLDQGRLRVAPPMGWYLAPRSKQYVVRFVQDRAQHAPLPRITIEACDWDQKEFGELRDENVWDFCEVVTNRLDEPSRRALDGRVEPLILGSAICAHYVVHKQYRVGERVIRGSREVIQTLWQGRLYSINLDVYAGKLIDYRADAYAVTASMEFLTAELSPDDAQP